MHNLRITFAVVDLTNQKSVNLKTFVITWENMTILKR